MASATKLSDGLRVLCLDGPSFPAAALSEPLFLQQIAYRWAYTEDNEDAIEGDGVRVIEMFDVIGGSGIGGLYAILFARLNMTVGQVIRFHNILFKKLFMADCWARKDHNDCTIALDRILNQLGGIEVDLDSPFFSKDGTKCFIAVLNDTKGGTYSLRTLRTYQIRTYSSPNCTIRQALHVTLADLEHFPAVSIGDELFIDASCAFPNVSRLLVRELASAFPKFGLACLVNLGADNAHPTNDSHMIGQDLMSQFKDLGCFFRLSVRDDLHAESRTKSLFWDIFCLFCRPKKADPSAKTRIKSLVMGYLQEADVSTMVDEIVGAIKGCKQVVTMRRLGNLAGEDGKTGLRKDVEHLRNEEEIRRALEKIRAPDIFQPTREDGCLSGTREDVLEPIEDWVEEVDDNTPNIFWLDGYPGTGKTAICITLKQRLAEAGLLGASCFFRREDASRHGLSVLFRSIASQLVKNRPPIGNNIVQVANSDAFNLDNAPSTVFEKLVCGPLAVGSDSSSPVVLVLDAMDEFGQSDKDQQYLASLLLSRWIRLPRHCKLFIASRSQGNLLRHLNLPTHRIRRLAVGDVVSTKTTQDIRKFFEHSFENVQNSYRPSSSELEMLVQASSGLFIWANTVIEMAKKIKFRNPVQRFLQAVCTDNAIVEPGRMQSLHNLYRTVLNPLLDTEGMKDELPSEELLVKQAFFSALVCTRIPLTPNALSSLCASEVADIQFIAQELTPVMDSTHVLRFVHKSFFDYVLSDDFPIQLDLGRAELVFMRSCFNIMRAQLRFNMGNISSSYMLNSEVPELHKALSEELQYASCFWGTHLKECQDKAVTMAQPIDDFFNHQFLYWVEAVSILGCFREATEGLASLRAVGISTGASDFAQDALDFFNQFALPISQSYPHIYISALPWAPSTSLIRARYLDTVPQVLRILSSGDEIWPAQLAVIHGHSSSVLSVSFSPGNSQIVSGSDDNTVRIWDAATRQPVGAPLRGHSSSVLSVAFSFDGSQIASGSADDTVRIWDVATLQLIGEPLRGHDGSVQSVTFSPDGSRIVSGSSDNTLRIWDAANIQPFGEPLRGHSGSVISVAFSPNGSQIVSGSWDNTIRIWDAITCQLVGGPLLGHDHSFESIAFSPDGSRIVSGSGDSTVRLWDAVTLQLVGGPHRGHSGLVLSVAFSPNGSQIVSGSSDHTLRIWDAATCQPIGEPIQGHNNWVQAVAFSSDGSHILSGSDDHTVRIWDAATRQPIGEPRRAHDNPVVSVVFSLDGSQIVSISSDNMVRIWDTTTCQPIGGPLRGYSSWVHSVAFSPSGSQIAGGSADNTVIIWDMVSLQPVGEPLRGHSSLVLSVAFSPDGSHIASGSDDNTVRIWNATTCQPVGEPLRGHDRSVRCVTFSPNSSQIASGSSDNTLRIWDASTCLPVGGPLRGHSSVVVSVAFSPDGSRIVSGSYDATIRIWDAATLELVVYPLYDHNSWVHSVAFSPDGSQIVSGSSDGAIRIWDSATGWLVGKPFRGHDSWVLSVRFSPDGSQIVSGSDDNTIRIWDAANIQEHKHTLRLNSAARHLVRKPPVRILKTLSFPRSSHLLPLKCFLLNDGWVTDKHACRLVWIPHHLHQFLPTQGLVNIISPRGMVFIDTSDMQTGTEWSSCVGRTKDEK